MQYEFFTEMQEEIILFGSQITTFLQTTIGEVLGEGANTFLPSNVLEMDLMSFILGTGVVVILGWNLIKWALPFFD